MSLLLGLGVGLASVSLILSASSELLLPVAVWMSGDGQQDDSTRPRPVPLPHPPAAFTLKCSPPATPSPPVCSPLSKPPHTLQPQASIHPKPQRSPPTSVTLLLYYRFWLGQPHSVALPAAAVTTKLKSLLSFLSATRWGIWRSRCGCSDTTPPAATSQNVNSAGFFSPLAPGCCRRAL